MINEFLHRHHLLPEAAAKVSPPERPSPPPEHTRTGRSEEAIRRAFLDNLFYLQGRYLEEAGDHDRYMALAYTVRDRLLERWIRTTQSYKQSRARTVCYFSAEFLLGPHLANNLINLGIYDQARQALTALELDLEDLLEQEPEPGLGNGGLGRLAACYLDSLATLQIPAIGYGIRYEFGIFRQAIHDGWQEEIKEHWLRHGNPWELARTQLRFPIQFGGHTRHYEEGGHTRTAWVPDLIVHGVAYDTPIPGYGVNNVNLLRLWQSRAAESFRLDAFNQGDHLGAVSEKVMAENITKVLYPNDHSAAGKELRLRQQYFFCSCSLQDMLRIYLEQHSADDFSSFPDKFAVQLNDTHPAIAVVELLRLLLDEHRLEWEAAWGIVRRTFAYTNHTLLPEALETWPVELLGRVLPRHLELIYEINMRFLDEVRMRYPYDQERIGRLSLIDEGDKKAVRMANLACLGSHTINGVAALHTRLLQETVLRDFYELWPERFHNKTNGVSPRRFLMVSNPRLAGLLRDQLGAGWTRDLTALRALEGRADDHGLQEVWRAIKTAAKGDLAEWLRRHTGVSVDPESLFDVQVKRIHEYKRPHLNLLHILTLYNRLKHRPDTEMAPRTFLFGGKAAPGYAMAKLIIKLINSVAWVINQDPQVNDRLRVVFVPDFNIKHAQPIYAAADLSEQISTAGLEASGTGNMKLSMNGALTIGTLDGANIEILEEVGAENFFLFGLTAEEVTQRRAQGYAPSEVIRQQPELEEALALLESGLFSHGDPELFRPLTQQLREQDPHFVCADYAAYLAAQQAVADTWRDPARWSRMSILNVARIGKFSSDRAIREYCRDIWHATPVEVRLSDEGG
jgi:glycogen phosphorylase